MTTIRLPKPDIGDAELYISPKMGDKVFFDTTQGQQRTFANVDESAAREIIEGLQQQFPALYAWKPGPIVVPGPGNRIEFIEGNHPEVNELIEASSALAELLQNWSPLKRAVVERFLKAVAPLE